MPGWTDYTSHRKSMPLASETAMIEVEQRDNVTIVTLNHGRANALDVELLHALDATLARIADVPGAAVLTGRGPIFSAGVDLVRLNEEGAPYVDALVAAVTRTLTALLEVPRPVVAALNGHAIAGGCILAGACDYKLMAEGEGRIGAPELLVGVPFPAIAFEILRSTIATYRLREAVYLGKTYGPDEAREVGLVDEVVDPDALIDRAVEVATAMAEIPVRSFEITKRQLRKPVMDLLDRHHGQIDDEVEDTWRSAEARRSIKAYVARVLRR
jgi:enoyl-CoA hydratase